MCFVLLPQLVLQLAILGPERGQVLQFPGPVLKGIAEGGRLGAHADADLQPERFVDALQVDPGQQDLRIVSGAEQPQHPSVRHCLHPAAKLHARRQVRAHQLPHDPAHHFRHHPHSGHVHQAEAIARVDAQAFPAPILRQRHLDALPTVRSQEEVTRFALVETSFPVREENLDSRFAGFGGQRPLRQAAPKGHRLFPGFRGFFPDLPVPHGEHRHAEAQGVGGHGVIASDVLRLGRAGAEKRAQQRGFRRLATRRFPDAQPPAVPELETLAFLADFLPELPGPEIVVTRGDVVKERDAAWAEFAPPRLEIVPDGLVGVQAVEMDQVKAPVGEAVQSVVEGGAHQIGEAGVKLLVVAAHIFIDVFLVETRLRVALPGIDGVADRARAVFFG